MPRKPRTHEEIKKFMDSLENVPSALVSSESPPTLTDSEKLLLEAYEARKHIPDLTGKGLLKDVKEKYEAQLKLDNEKRAAEEFKKNPKNWVGVCNFCQNDVVAKTETRYSGTPRIGGPSTASTVVNYFYCKGCSVLYHTCVNKKEI